MLFLIFRFPELKNVLGSFLVRQKSGAPPALKAPENYPRGRFLAHTYIINLYRLKVSGAGIDTDTAGDFPPVKNPQSLAAQWFPGFGRSRRKKNLIFFEKVVDNCVNVRYSIATNRKAQQQTPGRSSGSPVSRVKVNRASGGQASTASPMGQE